MNEADTRTTGEERYGSALSFYDARSRSNKWWYRFLSVYVIVVSAGLSLFIAFAPKESEWRMAAAALTTSIVIATGLLSHFKFHENWLSFRSYWDALKREKAYRDAGIFDYKNTPDRDALFAERVETILAKEGSEFFARHEVADDPSKPGGKRKARSK